MLPGPVFVYDCLHLFFSHGTIVKFTSKQCVIFLLSLEITSFQFIAEMAAILHHLFSKTLTPYAWLKFLLGILYSNSPKRHLHRDSSLKNERTLVDERCFHRVHKALWVGLQMLLVWGFDAIPRNSLFLKWQHRAVVWIICSEQYLWFLRCTGNFNSDLHVLGINT